MLSTARRALQRSSPSLSLVWRQSSQQRKLLGPWMQNTVSSVRTKSSSLESYTETPIGGRPASSTQGNNSNGAAVNDNNNNNNDNNSKAGKDACHPYVFPFDENGDTAEAAELISFPVVDRNSPTYNSENMPVLLNSKEHAIGYLSKILNARVYEACIETDLQHAKNLSAVSEHRPELHCNAPVQSSPVQSSRNQHVTGPHGDGYSYCTFVHD